MPWTVADVDEHKKGLDADGKKKWVAIANDTLKRCKQRSGAKNCDAQAIRMANSLTK